MRTIDSSTIAEEVKKNSENILNWLKKLISFPSENRPPEGFEKETQEFIAEELLNLGMDIDVFYPDKIEGIKNHPSWLDGRNYSNGRVNVVGKWTGGEEKSLLFSGHADVAPHGPGNWVETEPYKPLLKGGKLYGRGSADLKGGMASAFWAIKILKDLGFEPSGDIVFESVVDEEYAGGNGTLASRLKGYNTDLAVLVEPTRMQVCLACLGAILGEISLKGNAGMPYMGSAIANPIYGASKIVEIFKSWEKRWIASNSHPLFTGKDKELKILIWDIDSKIKEEFTQMGTPLITKLSWIVWCYPGENEDSFLKDFKKFWHEKSSQDHELRLFDVEIKSTYHYVRPWETSIENIGVAELINSYREYTKTVPEVTGAPFSCDYAIYGDTGNMPTVILGPRGDNLHAPDEWVLLEDIFTLTGIFASTAAKWCK